MPKYVIKEGIVDKFLTAVFNSVLKGKQRAILKALDKDPVLKKLVKDEQESLEDLKKYIEKHQKAGTVPGGTLPASVAHLFKK
ncbi:MAG TPA: hypothetical protein QF458_01605 [Candidatus Woesearchaeota archaeon]|jgi:hypothetical protein|nr:hypothetical protein [Candidatus Woesearchaeota archaeon]|tara:strand:- start:284 stop:532 length:249 start_codon:yes stop_codon:yes gene_type:complete